MIDTPPLHDSVLPFTIDALNVRGRIVRLHTLPQELLRHHNYPPKVNAVLMQAATICILLGSAIKLDGRLILQTQTDGPISMLVVDYESPSGSDNGRVRAYARFDEALVSNSEPQDLLGIGHMALTIDLGTDASRYQGIVALDSDGLEVAANHYFKQSEQLPTRIQLMVDETEAGILAGGVFLQALPISSEVLSLEIQLANDNQAADGEEPNPFETEDWREAEARVLTLTPEELLHEEIDLGHLLLRLFNPHGVRVFETVPMEAFCRCSEARVKDMLMQFEADDRAHMEKDGKVGVTCEFCSRFYEFDAAEIVASTPHPGA